MDSIFDIFNLSVILKLNFIRDFGYNSWTAIDVTNRSNGNTHEKLILVHSLT